MNNLNSVLVEGKLIRNPLLKHTGRGIAICTFSIASERFCNSDTGVKKEVSIFDVETWGKLAEACYNQGKKGRGLRVVGRLKQERWTGEDGKAHSKVTVVAEHVEFRPVFADPPQPLTCDRCGKDIEHDWYYGEGPVCAGNCTECGDNLCKDCAGSWDEDGRCQACQNGEKKQEGASEL